MHLHRAQGATEYLVLLAIVLIVALVSVALLGFFPGMASDSQITQSQMYWKSTSPIQIIESDARADSRATGQHPLYLRIRNAGSYPVRITKVIADNNQSLSTYWIPGTTVNMSDTFYMAPGEEKYFGYTAAWSGLPTSYGLSAGLYGGGASGSYIIYAAQSICQNSSTSPGTLSISGFGFEYFEYLDNGQQITKREIGKPLVIKCGPPF